MRLPMIFSLSLLAGYVTVAHAVPAPVAKTIKDAFATESITLSQSQLSSIEDLVRTAHRDYCRTRAQGETSTVKFAAVEIASMIGLSPSTDLSLTTRITRALQALPCEDTLRCSRDEARCVAPDDSPQNFEAWDRYYDETLALNNDPEFLSLVREKGFSPVKISWEDIGRYAGSVWGDRISDVGIWVRKRESDPQSASLALSVRRDENFRDKVLVVPAQAIKIHIGSGNGTREVSLPERLKELGLTSKTKDKNVIVSNQFAIVPVPGRGMGTRSDGQPPRAAFTFSIFPYGSTNFVITDVIEGSSNAVVGPGTHQLLFHHIDGQRAPFTASRAAERKDLLALEENLKAKGMDVDVQRYYLIQIPLRRDAPGIKLSNMGTPPLRYHAMSGDGIGLLGAATMEMEESAPAQSRQRGLDKVAIGHGETEGDYFEGDGYRGNRAEEPIRVTVVYFVTPNGKVTPADMNAFAQAFESWDSQAIWHGSFVTAE